MRCSSGWASAARGARARVRRAAAVSAPLDLGAAGDALDRGLNRLLYTRHFLSSLKPKSFAKLEVFPDLFDADKVRAARTSASSTTS
jgi:predicted alpha/beta-fold hydrolase